MSDKSQKDRRSPVPISVAADGSREKERMKREDEEGMIARTKALPKVDARTRWTRKHGKRIKRKGEGGRDCCGCGCGCRNQSSARFALSSRLLQRGTRLHGRCRRCRRRRRSRHAAATQEIEAGSRRGRECDKKRAGRARDERRESRGVCASRAQQRGSSRSSLPWTRLKRREKQASEGNGEASCTLFAVCRLSSLVSRLSSFVALFSRLLPLSLSLSLPPPHSVQHSLASARPPCALSRQNRSATHDGRLGERRLSCVSIAGQGQAWSTEEGSNEDGSKSSGIRSQGRCFRIRCPQGPSGAEGREERPRTTQGIG